MKEGADVKKDIQRVIKILKKMYLAGMLFRELNSGGFDEVDSLSEFAEVLEDRWGLAAENNGGKR